MIGRDRGQRLRGCRLTSQITQFAAYPTHMIWRVGDFINKAAEDRKHQVALSVTISIILFAVDFVLEYLMASAQISIAAHATIEAILVAGCSGLSAWLLLEAARTRRRRLRRELQESARLNHEIRNALEVIAHAGYLVNDVVYGRAIADSVERIRKSLEDKRSA